jgi:hypothetical protein
MSRRWPPEPIAAAAALLILAACAPGAPPGVKKQALDDAVSRAIGDPNSCLLIAEKGSGTMKTKDLLEAVAKDGRPRQLSCNTLADASRGVGWAAGPVAGKDLVYAAMMEGDRAFPGMMMADRLDGAFRRAGLSAKSR